jgi:hypothetical protein
MLYLKSIFENDDYHEAVTLIRKPSSGHLSHAGPTREIVAVRRFAETLWRWWVWGYIWQQVGWMRKEISPDLHRAKAAEYDDCVRRLP